MKDIISTLQSRIAKRQNTISLFEQYQCYHPFLQQAAEEQKQDKRILAEIIRLRRELKGSFKRESQLIDKFGKTLTELENEVFAAYRWGE